MLIGRVDVLGVECMYSVCEMEVMISAKCIVVWIGERRNRQVSENVMCTVLGS